MHRYNKEIINCMQITFLCLCLVSENLYCHLLFVWCLDITSSYVIFIPGTLCSVGVQWIDFSQTMGVL